MIALRLRAGRRRKAEKGGYAYGAPPFGHRAQDGELVRDEAEQATLARMCELRRSGSSLREIASILEGEGFKPRRSKRWHPVVVQRVLDRVGVQWPSEIDELSECA
jgi:hypothetical protein